MAPGLRRRAGAGLALAVLVCAACGDDDSPSRTDAGRDASPPPSLDAGLDASMHDAASPPTEDGAMPPGDDAAPPPSDGGSTDPVADFCMRGAMIECTGNQRCCPTPDPSVEACAALRAGTCVGELTRLLDARPGLHIDTTRTEAFYDYLEAIADDCAGPDPDPGRLPLAGTIAEGGDCIGSGSSSDLTFLQCTEGLACAIDPVARTGRCAPRPGAGDTCTSPYMCPFGTFCDADFEVMPFVPGTCVALLADGTACTSGDQCREGACESSLCLPLAQTFCFGA